ncbi:hypothetical protein AYI68_g606 [Smittium mucronatum]|uniref:Uncharacterized protein n=1 Tax=Smittium mucronatum TaxID=133383 RepID=A0A1R0H7P9_9FUNG|nr:hypothetical protein AYI68_g606 [Smittium mucronatum]
MWLRLGSFLRGAVEVETAGWESRVRGGTTCTGCCCCCCCCWGTSSMQSIRSGVGKEGELDKTRRGVSL